MFSFLPSIWVWIKGRLGEPLSVLAFLMATALGGGATFVALWILPIGGLVFALVGIPVIFGLASFVPRVGGALSLGGNLGAGVALVAVLV